ncbi:MAG: hypothetical protein NTX16_11420 [Actinobacteria bacterium]|nr:hypothetical protein [Actinomycetota bacterium]
MADVDEPAGDVRRPEPAFPEPAALHHAPRAALMLSIVRATGYRGEIWIEPRVGPELRQDLDEAGLGRPGYVDGPEQRFRIVPPTGERVNGKYSHGTHAQGSGE